MSDPVTNVEIEDVLSSIRRLVADDAREQSAPQSGKGKPERLVLTPAQRVPDDAPKPATGRGDGSSTKRPASENRLRAEPGRAPAPASAERENVAVPFRLNRDPKAETPSRERPETAERPESDKVGPAAAARRLTLGLTASDEEFEEIYEDGGDEPSFDASTLLGKLVEEELARALASPEGDARPKFARSRPAQAKAPESAAETQGADETAQLLDRIAEVTGGDAADAADDGIPTAEVPLPEPELPELSPRIPEPELEDEPAGDVGLAQKIAALEAMIARHKGDEPAAQVEPATVQEPEQGGEIEVAPEPVAESHEPQGAEAARAAFVHRPQKPLEWQDHKPDEVVAEAPRRAEALVLEGPTWKGADRGDVLADTQHLPDVAASEDGDALPAPVDLFDEEMLRDLVTEIIRQELQGALGERITRNVRKMVRREIHRMVTSEHFD